MKKLIIVLISLMGIVSCTEEARKEVNSSNEALPVPQGEPTSYVNYAANVIVVRIDSCEYILARTGFADGGISIIHKQNCKLCLNRNK